MQRFHTISLKTLKIWPWLAALVAAWVGYRWILWSRRGFDFQDEGSYLLLSQDPWRNTFSSLFGFVLHPLYLLSFQDPGWFRLNSVLVLAAAAMGCAYAWWVRNKIFSGDILGKLGVAALLITGALLVYSDGRRTPSYDTLVFLGALVAWAGYFGLGEERGLRFWSWCAIANGLFFSFLAKWPSGVLMVPLFFWMIWKNNLWRRSDLALVLALTFSLAAFWTWWIGIQAIRETAQMVDFLVNKSISHGPQLLPYYGATLVNFLYRCLRAFAYGLPLLLFFWLLYRRKARNLSPLPAVAWVLPWVILAGGLFFGLTRAGASSFSRVGSNVVAEVLWLAAACLMVCPWRGWPRFGFRLLESIGLFLTPFILGFGTASALGDYVGHGALFFQLVGLGILGVLLHQGAPRPLVISFIFLGVILNLFRAEASLRDQFRTAPMNECVVPWPSPDGGTIYLDAEKARLLGELQAKLGEQQFKRGDPIVAIGDMPGIVYFLGGYSPGANWYPATHSEHLRFALALLQSVPPEAREQAFLIINEKSPLYAQKDEILRWVGAGEPYEVGPYLINSAPERFFLWPPRQSR